MSAYTALIIVGVSLLSCGGGLKDSTKLNACSMLESKIMLQELYKLVRCKCLIYYLGYCRPPSAGSSESSAAVLLCTKHPPGH